MRQRLRDHIVSSTWERCGKRDGEATLPGVDRLNEEAMINKSEETNALAKVGG